MLVNSVLGINSELVNIAGVVVVFVVLVLEMVVFFVVETS